MNNKELKIFITFDVDLPEYIDNEINLDEFGCIFPTLLDVLKKFEKLKATWFIRIDNDVKRRYGRADYVFHKYGREIKLLKQGGHEIGWHPHPFIFENKKLCQNTNEEKVIEELSQNLPLVKKWGHKIVRMGWGYCSNKIMHFLADSGFVIDSSAIPRPNYSNQKTKKDWSITSVYPYYPSKADYRIPGKPNLNILEVPISCAEIPAPSDHKKGIIRYFNLAYHWHLLKEPLKKWISSHNHIVFITHLYELYPIKQKHELITFDISSIKNNLSQIEELAKNVGFCNVVYSNLLDLTSHRIEKNYA